MVALPVYDDFKMANEKKKCYRENNKTTFFNQFALFYNRTSNINKKFMILFYRLISWRWQFPNVF
jgi:hypothetical protein